MEARKTMNRVMVIVGNEIWDMIDEVSDEYENSIDADLLKQKH